MKLSNRLKKQLKTKYGPWALITGASSGIGKELAEQLAGAGIHLVLTARRKNTLDELASILEAKYGVRTKNIVADLSTMEGVYKLTEDIGKLKIGCFIASAGFGTSGYFINGNLTSELDMVQVNCVTLMMLTHYFSRKFAEQGNGGIILMSSIVGFQGVPNAAHYGATKAYVQSLAEGIYHELKPYGVDVLAAAPGPVNTRFAARAHMNMKNALKPSDIGIPILKALGGKSTAFPGKLTKLLIFGLRTVPRWGKIRIMKMVMDGMTKHRIS
ncbi:MAG: SDR family NAD(P)-dependent oxidoreductase [Saonia sp.]